MSDLFQVTDENFDEVVLKSELPVVVDFWAPWCGPCRMMTPRVEQAAAQLEGKVKFVAYNCDNSSGIAVELGIQSIPTLVIYKGGRPVDRRVGLLDATALNDFISSNM